MLLVQRLRQAERVLRRETEAAVGFALQAGEIEEQRRQLRRGLGFLGDRAALAVAFGADRLGLLRIPEPLGLPLGVLGLLPCGIEPAAGIFSGLGAETRVHLPVVARLEGADLFLALDEDRERRRLHAADRGEVEAAFLGIEGGHCARAVDAYQPVGFRTRLGGVGEREHVAVGAQLLESFADRRLRHRLQPEALDRLFRLRVLHDVAKDELAFAARVARIDQRVDVLALDQAQQHIEARFAALDRAQLEVRRDHRQVIERPFAFLDVVRLGQGELEQMTDRRRDDAIVAFEPVALLREAAERLCDIGSNRRFFGDDELLAHGFERCLPWKGADDKRNGRRMTTDRITLRALEAASVRQAILRGREQFLGDQAARGRLQIPQHHQYDKLQLVER